MPRFTLQKPVQHWRPLRRLQKHGICFEKNVDHQANRNNEFLHSSTAVNL